MAMFFVEKMRSLYLNTPMRVNMMMMMMMCGAVRQGKKTRIEIEHLRAVGTAQIYEKDLFLNFPLDEFLMGGIYIIYIRYVNIPNLYICIVYIYVAL